MKYHTLGSSSVVAETRTSGFTLYADMGISEHTISYTEKDMKKIREQLENVQRDLKLQTMRCRHLVAEFTRKLQEKEQLYQNEKALRDTQLAKVLKALLIFEARLRQEQKLISHQLSEKDYIINSQTNDIKKLLANQYCKNCNQYYSPAMTLESFDSSSEYVGTEPDYQSSNLESLDSSSETYAASEREYPRSESEIYEKVGTKTIFLKNKHSSHGRRKVMHRKSIGSYFEVLKLRNDSPLSNEDNTSADYDNLDSLPPESISDKISTVSENIENMLNKTRSLGSTTPESSINISSSECDKTVIINTAVATKCGENITQPPVIVENSTTENQPENKLTDTLPVFESNGETNDNWYASASDQEDEDNRDVYRNNPVLECMNQILLQNINDMNSPPKTPDTERKTHKNNKRVKFSDEEDKHVAEQHQETHDYYETPIQKTPNFYETPQSIYSNDYEQILSKCSETSSNSSKPEIVPRKTVDSKESYHYIEMEKSQNQDQNTSNTNNPNRKSKILRAPPALPPKPPNLVSKCKVQILPRKPPSDHSSSADLEPDYCSISELNLPQNKIVLAKKISVVAEVHNPAPHDVKNKINAPSQPVKDDTQTVASQKEETPNLIVKKCVQKLNIQLAKHTPVRPEMSLTNIQSPKKKNDIQIPKLPQVSEIIIPDDPDEIEEEMVAQDNYVKNNTQILQSKHVLESRKPIVIGSSVSSLISGFNNHQILNEIKKKHERMKPEIKKVFSSFENLQNLDKHFVKNTEKTQSFENFDLSQNFEEFKLDDCEIEEYDVEEELNKEEEAKSDAARIVEVQEKISNKKDNSRVDYIRATDITLPSRNQTSIEILKRQLELQRNQHPNNEPPSNETQKTPTQPTYEHFLECTGLSSKSILTPSRLLTNHKHMLKPKDVKLRSKVRASASISERPHGVSKIKYWSEPFV